MSKEGNIFLHALSTLVISVLKIISVVIASVLKLVGLLFLKLSELLLKATEK